MQMAGVWPAGPLLPGPLPPEAPDLNPNQNQMRVPETPPAKPMEIALKFRAAEKTEGFFFGKTMENF